MVNEELRRRCESLCSALGLSFVRGHGKLWVKDTRRADGGNYTSFVIRPDRKTWKDYSSYCQYSRYHGGDLISLVAEFQTRGNMLEAIWWALKWTGLDHQINPEDYHLPWLPGEEPKKSEAPDAPPRDLVAERKAAEERDKQRREEDEKRNAALIAIARRIFFYESEPLTGSDPASLYLMQRGIDVLAFKDGPPRALRFCPECLAKPENVRLPAMVAHVAKEGHGMIALHRTYLEFANGIWRKAWKGKRDGNDRPIPAKRVIAATSGGSVRLQRGASGKPLKQAPRGEWIAVSEGIENGLTLALACPEYRVLSALSVANVGSIELPPQIGGVMIIVDNDKPGKDGIRPVDRAMDRLAERGIEPALIKTEQGFKDINDMLIGAHQ